MRRHQYAAEGSVLVGGAALQWLRDGLGLIRRCRRERGWPARQVERRGGRSWPRSQVSVAALDRMPAAYQRHHAGTTRAQIVRASPRAWPISRRYVDVLRLQGSAAGRRRRDANGFLMQLQAISSVCGRAQRQPRQRRRSGLQQLAGRAVGCQTSRPGALFACGARYEPSGATGRMSSRPVRMRHAASPATLPR